MYKILKQISKDVKETARIQGNTTMKLWNTTNINESQLEYNSANYWHAFITLDEVEKVLKLTKNCKTPGQDNINSELYKYAPEEFKLRLLQFLNNIYRENRIPNEWRNAIITPVFKKKVTDGNPKTTEELVFSTPAIRYTLKSLIWNCRITPKYSLQIHKMDFEREGHARIQHFASNY